MVASKDRCNWTPLNPRPSHWFKQSQTVRCPIKLIAYLLSPPKKFKKKKIIMKLKPVSNALVLQDFLFSGWAQVDFSYNETEHW